jgi:hypothetical protein
MNIQEIKDELATIYAEENYWKQTVCDMGRVLERVRSQGDIESSHIDVEFVSDSRETNIVVTIRPDKSLNVITEKYPFKYEDTPLQDNFVVEGEMFKCMHCGETVHIPMPISIDTFVAFSYAFQISHLKKCFDFNEPWDELEKTINNTHSGTLPS